MVKIDEVLERYSKKLDRAIDRHSNKRSVSSTMDEVFRYLRNIQNKPVPVQLAIGASSGFVTSYFLTRISKFIAAATGFALIAIQFLNYRGYIKFRSSQIQRDIDRLSDQIWTSDDILPPSNQIGDFLSKNTWLLGGFISGCLIGYGLA